MRIPLESSTPSFGCNACGSCCSHIRGFIPESDKRFIEEYAFGKLPVVQLVPVSQMTFPLWDWEASRFKEWGQEVDIEPHVKPLRAIYDMNSGKAIVLTYFMDSKTDACPMLIDKKCSIYHTKRAYVCRLFPFNKSPFSFAGKIEKEQLFGECGAMERLVSMVPQEMNEAIPILQEMFPQGEFLNAVQNDIVVEWANRTIVDLMQKKLIRPIFNVPYAGIKAKIDSAPQVDFSDFLVECGYLSMQEKDALISSFDENTQAIKITTCR
jgi:Fe-S-cluster containining protein